MKNVAVATTLMLDVFEPEARALLGESFTPARSEISVSQLVSGIVSSEEDPVCLILCNQGLMCFSALEGASGNVVGNSVFVALQEPRTLLVAQASLSGGRSRVLSFPGATITPPVVAPPAMGDAGLLASLAFNSESRWSAAQLAELVDGYFRDSEVYDVNKWALVLDQMSGKVTVFHSDNPVTLASIDVISIDMANNFWPKKYVFNLSEIIPGAEPDINTPVWG